MLEALRLQGTEEQKRFFYDRVLAGERIFNALSERGTKTAQDHATRLTRSGDGYRLDGTKFYSTGVLFAHWIAVVANDENGLSTLAFVPRDTPGIQVDRRLDRLRPAHHGVGHHGLERCSGSPVLGDPVQSPVRGADRDGALRPDHACRDRTGHRGGGARHRDPLRAPPHAPVEGQRVGSRR